MGAIRVFIEFIIITQSVYMIPPLLPGTRTVVQRCVPTRTRCNSGFIFVTMLQSACSDTGNHVPTLLNTVELSTRTGPSL